MLKTYNSTKDNNVVWIFDDLLNEKHLLNEILHLNPFYRIGFVFQENERNIYILPLNSITGKYNSTHFQSKVFHFHFRLTVRRYKSLESDDWYNFVKLIKYLI